MIPAENPPNGINVIVTFADGTEAVVYFWKGNWYIGVPDDPIDLELEPIAIVAWRHM